MLALLPLTPLTSLRSLSPPLQELSARPCRGPSHRQPVVVHTRASLCRTTKQQPKRDVSVAARVVAENPTAPEVKAGQQARFCILQTVVCESQHLRKSGVLQVKWFAVVANAEFMLHDVQNEAFAEQLRERRRLLLERDQQVNFFIVSEPAWLDEKFPTKAKQVRRPCVALISTDEQWIL